MAYILSWKSNQIFTCLSVMSELCGTVPVQVIRNATDFQSPYLWKTNSETYYHCKKNLQCFETPHPPKNKKLAFNPSQIDFMVIVLFCFCSCMFFCFFFQGRMRKPFIAIPPVACSRHLCPGTLRPQSLTRSRPNLNFWESSWPKL